jgi:hypothetical protein
MMRLMSKSARESYGVRDSLYVRPVLLQVTVAVTDSTSDAPPGKVTITGWREYMKAMLFG